MGLQRVGQDWVTSTFMDHMLQHSGLCWACDVRHTLCLTHGVLGCSVMSLWPSRLLCPWGFPGKNTGVGWHFLLQGSSWLRDQTHVSLVSPALEGTFFTTGCHLGNPFSDGLRSMLSLSSEPFSSLVYEDLLNVFLFLMVLSITVKCSSWTNTAPVSSENLLHMQIIEPHPRLPESETWKGPRNLCFNQSSLWLLPA